jgi:hypothetical protein
MGSPSLHLPKITLQILGKAGLWGDSEWKRRPQANRAGNFASQIEDQAQQVLQVDRPARGDEIVSDTAAT